jgi:hypothetical protein
MREECRRRERGTRKEASKEVRKERNLTGPAAITIIRASLRMARGASSRTKHPASSIIASPCHRVTHMAD